jgi:poly(3-hydroxybutyrate) depolymerase
MPYFPSRSRRRAVGLSLAGSATWLLQACSPIAFLERRVPEDTYRLVQDIAYGSHPRQRLDVYMPLDMRRPAPVFVFFYGGAWTSGTRGFYRFVGEAFAARGIVTVVPDYRLHPEVRFPDFLDDSARAVRWALDHAAKHGGDPSRVFIGGHSAGLMAVELAAVGGPVIVASDTAHFYETMEGKPFPIVHDMPATLAGHAFLRARRDAGATVVPGHDPAVLARFPAVPGQAGAAVRLG